MGCGNFPSAITSNNQNLLISNNPGCYLWTEYKNSFKNSNIIPSDSHKIKNNNINIEFEYIIIGDKPNEGYPLYICLHDGEVSHTSNNTNEYKKMKTYYLKSITLGICLACRGISDQSNCHYTNESFELFEKMIKEMFVFYNANPNKVYLLGVGFGGDAVYQIASRLAERFAGVSINSGHTFGINLKNLINLPIIIQVGESNIYFEKNKNAVNAFATLKELYREYSIDPPPIECYIHIGKGKKIIDNKIKNAMQNVINDPLAWLKGNEYTSVIKNTNAISFLSQFTRNPYPNKLVWDLTKCYKKDFAQKKTHKSGKKLSVSDINGELIKSETETPYQTEGTISHFSGTSISKMELTSNSQFYWLEIGNKTLSEIGTVEIVAQYEKEKNKILILTPVKYLRILLCDEMINFDNDVEIAVGNFTKKLKITRNFATERRSMEERGDYNFIFSAVILIESFDLVNYKIEQFNEKY